MAHFHNLLHDLGLKKELLQNPWEWLGFAGAAVFFIRFIVQWYATEKKKQVVVPAAFWWLSIAGSLMMLIYSVYLQKFVLILQFLPNCIPYTRNLIIHGRHKREHRDCPSCGTICPPKSNYCLICGTKLDVIAVK